MSFKPNSNVEIGLFKLIIESFIGKDLNERNSKVEIKLRLENNDMTIDYSGAKYKSNQYSELVRLTDSIVFQFGRWMEEDNNIYTISTDRMYVRVHKMIDYKELTIDLTGMFKPRNKAERLSDYGLTSTSLSEILKDDNETKEKTETMKSSFLESYPHIEKLSYGQKVKEVTKHIKTMVDALSSSYGLETTCKAVMMEDLHEVYTKEVAEEIRLAEIKLKELRKQNLVISESIED